MASSEGSAQHLRLADRTRLRSRGTVAIVLQAAFSTIFCNLKLQELDTFDITSLEVIFKSFAAPQFFMFLAIVGILRYDARLPRSYRKSVPIHILAILYSFFMVEGRYFYTDKPIDLFSPYLHYFVLSALALVGYYLFIRPAISILSVWLDIFMDRMRRGRFSGTGRLARIGRLAELMGERPMLTAFVLLCIMLVPVVLISYPGVMMGDTWNQIAQGYNLPSYQHYKPLLDPNIKLNNHHPITHTLLLHGCLVAGTTLFHSWNAGLFIYVCLQAFVVILSFSNLERVAVKCCKVPATVALIATVLLGLHPRIQTYIVLVSKDAIYAALLVLFLSTLVELALSGWKVRALVVLCVSMLCSMLIRNDGVYVVVPTLIAFLAVKSARKAALIALPIAICFFMVWNNVILPGFSITKGSPREMLSVPFQQTARYLKYYGDDVTPEERDAIAAVLDYDRLPELYSPERADPVKYTFNDAATKDQVIAYFKAWYQMFWRHPATYFHATLNNLSEYYYPNTTTHNAYGYSRGDYCMDYTNDKCWEIETDFHFPQSLNGIKTIYESIREGVFGMPLLGFVLLACTYVWSALFLFVYALRSRSRLSIALTVPFLMQILILSAGPMNGSYFRYAYPLLACMPLLLAVLSVREPEAEEGVQES